MASKHPSGRPARRVLSRPIDGGLDDRTALIFDITQSRIESFNRENGGGVSVRKWAKGYTLIRDDTGESVARLRSQPAIGQYEILRRSDGGERWQALGSTRLILPLDEALGYIAEDPLGCFWE